MPGRLASDEAGAASSVIAFMVAGVVFIGSVGALLLASQDSADHPGDGSADAATLRLQSESLADLLVGSPGFHLSSDSLVCGSQPLPCYAEDWTAVSADDLGRLGLREPGSALMDFEKFENLRRAGLASSSSDGRVNYPDARDSLGLDETDLDFHVRAFPSLRSVRDLLASSERDPNLRVAYVGDVEAVSHGGSGDPSEGLTVHALTCTAGAGYLTLSVPITHGGAASDTQFSGFFDVDWTGSTADYEDRARTSVVGSGSGATLSLRVPATAGRTCATGEVDLEVWDPNSELWSTPNNAPFDLSGSAPSSTVANDLWVNPGRGYYEPGENVVIDFGGDLPTKGSDPDVDLALVIKSGASTLHSETVTVDKNVRSVTIDDAVFTSGNDFTVELTYPGGVTVTDTILVTNTVAVPVAFAPSSGTISYDAQEPVAPEVGFLDTLVDLFCPYYFDTTAYAPADSPLATAPDSTRCDFRDDDAVPNPQLGDVFPDTRDVLNNDLPLRLLDPSLPDANECNGHVDGSPRYDWTKVLVIGSNVDHNSMTSADAKYAVCEWVFGGGTLIVFGSLDQRVTWLEPIFKAAITSSSAPVSTPDMSHPILNRADTLSYDGYRSNGTKVWSFNGQTAENQEQLLTNVVASGADSILTISNPGAFGDGTVILTTWLPYDLFNADPDPATGSEAEGLALVNNFLMQGYRDLFLDYGPQIPSATRQAAAAQRVVDIQHPEFEDPITLTLFVYVF